LAANLQPESQKLLWRLRATSGDRDFSQEDQKDRRQRMGVRAAARGLLLPLRAEWRGEPIRPSDLLSFL
jgi:hypothetical protein